MPKRQDGKETKMKLLNAACELFAQKGYQETKVSDICELAGANVASVNYYFGSKAKLYVETWRYVFDTSEDPVLSINESGDPEIDSGNPEKRLRQFIHVLLQDFYHDDLENSLFNRLYLLEVVKPTGLIDDVWHQLIDPTRAKMHMIMRDLLGTETENEQLLLCELSIYTQMRALTTIRRNDLEFIFRRAIDDDFVNTLAEHIAEFSLAGIEEIKRKQK